MVYSEPLSQNAVLHGSEYLQSMIILRIHQTFAMMIGMKGCNWSATEPLREDIYHEDRCHHRRI